ncbi:hypothetical protein MUP37_05720, partial [Candidatus Bathyarchaeota archaeon]|nr:hypothetical protein [Candidatus Bathyarchaeota archaeon]
TNEAKCIQFMRENGWFVKFEDFPKDLSIYDAELSNLIRLGLIRQTPARIKVTQTRYDEDSFAIGEADEQDLRFELTELGSNTAES